MNKSLILLALGVVAVSLLMQRHSTPTFGAAEFPCNSPEDRLIRYVAKQEINKNSASWNDNPYVQQVRNADGSLNVTAVKDLLISRGIMTGPQFDTAVSNLKSGGYFGAKASQKALDYFNANKDCGVSTSTPPVDTGATTTP